MTVSEINAMVFFKVVQKGGDNGFDTVWMAVFNLNCDIEAVVVDTMVARMFRRIRNIFGNKSAEVVARVINHLERSGDMMVMLGCCALRANDDELLDFVKSASPPIGDGWQWKYAGHLISGCDIELVPCNDDVGLTSDEALWAGMLTSQLK